MRETKAQLAQASDLANAMAATTGLASAILFVVPAGQPAGVSLAILAGGLWVTGAILDDLADDPPRRDYFLVTMVRSTPLRRSVAASSAQTAIAEFHRLNTELAAELQGLLTSFERLQGARIDLKSRVGNADELALAIKRQRGAVRHNAAHAWRCVNTMLALVDDVNAAWRMLKKTHPVPPLTDRVEAIRMLWPMTAASFGATVPPARMEKARLLFENTVARDAPPPSEILNGKWFSAMLTTRRWLANVAGIRAQ